VQSGVPASELGAVLGAADVVVIRSATNLNSAVLQGLPKLKGVVRAGVGLDNIDVAKATELGVYVWNAPTGNFQSTAELAIGHMFALARRIAFATEQGRAGKWMKKELSGGRQISGSTVGVFGAGNIGLRAARMAAALGARVQLCDPVYNGTEFQTVDFKTLMGTSDFITIHSPLLDSTRHAFNATAFAMAKPGLCLVNAARGGIVHEADLVEALNAGRLGGAALDVFEKEPFDPKDPLTAKLLAHPLVVTTPHIGASTLEAQKAVGLEVADKVLRLARGEAVAPLNRPSHPRWAP